MGNRIPPRRGSACAVAAMVVAAAVTLLSPSSASAGPAALPRGDSHGITMLDAGNVPVPVDLNGDGRVTGSEQRLLEITMSSTVVFEPQPGRTPGISPVNIPIRLRVHLPPNYDPTRATPYPVLYLLHGGDGDYNDWSQPAGSGGSGSSGGGDGGDVVSIIDGQTAFQGIVVMPEGGDGGNYTDWFGWSNGHFRPRWETFHIDQLVPWVDDNFRTSRNAAGRAIAGLSMGGLGAMKYAGAHGDTFSAAAAFSGTVSMRRDDFRFAAAVSVNTIGASVGMGAGDPYGDAYTGPSFLFPDSYQPREWVIFGPESGWPALNPVDRAAAGDYASYAGRVFLYAGTDSDLLEGPVRSGTDQLHAALATTPHRYCRGPGNHTWPYWREDLRDFLANVYGSGTSTCTQNAGWVRVP